MGIEIPEAYRHQADWEDVRLDSTQGCHFEGGWYLDC